MRGFSRGLPTDEPRPRSSGTFAPALLPRSQKEELCKGLLDEFGARYTQRGDELVHGCLVTPSHQNQDREPTASLNLEKLTWHCLGCGASGGLLWFIATVRGCSTDEARRWLESETGTDGHAMDLAPLLRYLDAIYAPRQRPEPIPRLSERMLDAWEGIHPYLTDSKSTGYGRGIPIANCQQAKVGYAEHYKVGERPDKTPITSERIVLPHFWKGSLVGWQSRRLADDGTPKYLSSPGLPKDRTVYRYDPKAERVVVVEAMLSAISKSHLTHLEATFGASVTDEQVALLSKHPTIVLFLDNDDAGWKAVLGHDQYDKRGRLIEHTPGLGERLSRTSIVLVADNPYAADAADLDDEQFTAAVGGAVPFSAWRIPDTLLCHRCRATAHQGDCQ